MRALVQRVERAQVEVDHTVTGAIEGGLLIFLGVGQGDTEEAAQHLWDKIRKLRIFEDGQGKTNLALEDVGGAVLVVSQFTLYADCKKGNRPSFTQAEEPEGAERLYTYFTDLVQQDLGRVETGVFGAMMQVGLVNDGPFTIWLDTDRL